MLDKSIIFWKKSIVSVLVVSLAVTSIIATLASVWVCHHVAYTYLVRIKLTT